MNRFKLISVISISLIMLFTLSCDDRLPSQVDTTVETGSLELSYVFVNGATSNPTIVGEVLSDSEAKTSVIVIARLLDGDGNGVNGKSLLFSSDLGGSFDTQDPLTKFVPNMKEFGFPELGGNGYAYARFTPNSDEEKIETAASSGAIITVKYTEDIIDNVEFSVFSQKEQIWPYTMNITASPQVELGADSPYEVLLQNAYGHELSGVLLNIESANGSLLCGDTCYTDATGRLNTTFESYSFNENIGPGTINTSFFHPSINDTVTVAKQIIIGTENVVGSCAYIEIPNSVPSDIVVKDGGGIESTDIRAEVYDNNGTLLPTPITVNFRLEPILEGTYLNNPGQTSVNVETINGVATVSLNSGSQPGPVRVIATANTEATSVCDTLNDALESIFVPVVIASGEPYYIEAEYDPENTEIIGAGFYKTEVGASVYDRWYNPVEDTTYVYWTISPEDTNTVLSAFVEGVSFTNNVGEVSSEATQGVARSHIVYSTDAIGKITAVRALTFGANGDSVTTLINEGDGLAPLYFMPGEVTMFASATYHDFTQMGNPALITLSTLVIDAYGNPVVDVPVAFGGTGVSNFYELQYEVAELYTDSNGNGSFDAGEPFQDADGNGIWTGWRDEGVDGVGVGDGCFTWRDYGLDDDPATYDQGNYNQNHDSFDINDDNKPDTSEVSEFFNDWGLDNIPNTLDEGEGNGKWDGYSMINCEPVVRTDKDGYARIIAEFDQGLCVLLGESQATGLCNWETFTATLSSTLLIPQIASSDPVQITLARTPDVCD